MNKLLNVLSSALHVDLRSLALMRVCLGMLFIYDTINRMLDLEAFYSDFGVLPRNILLDNLSNPLHISILNIFGEVTLLYPLFACFSLIGLCFLIGYRTKTVGFLCFLWLVSISNRNGLVLNGGDVLLRSLFFWCLFLPTNAVFSVDSALSKSNKVTKENYYYVSLASIAIFAQICLLYITSVFHKSGSEWYPDLTATYYTLQLDSFTTPLGKWLGQYYTLSKVMTAGVLLTEFFAPILVILPVVNKYLRTPAIMALIAMHVSIDMSMKIGMFSMISIAMLLGALPHMFWEKITKLFVKSSIKSIHIPEDSALSDRLARIIRVFWVIPDAEITTSNSWDHKTTSNKTLNLNIRHSSERTSGLLNISKTLLREFVIFRFRLFRQIARQVIYAGTHVDAKFSHIKKSLSSLSSLVCNWLPLHENDLLKPQWGHQIVCVLIVLYVVGFNLQSVKNFPYRYPDTLKSFSHVLRLDQRWTMFAPYPAKGDGWYVGVGTLSNGNKVDALNFTHMPPTFKRPEDVSETYNNQRWRKFLIGLTDKKLKKYLEHYAQYICRKWNADSSEKDLRLDKLHIYFMLEKSVPYGQTPVVEKRLRREHSCYKQNHLAPSLSFRHLR